MTIAMIELGEGRTVPLTPPPQELGPAFAAVIERALTWDAAMAAALDDFRDTVTSGGGYDRAADRIREALRAAGLEWSCQFGEPGSDPEASPYIDTLAQQVSVGAADVAAAVLARDLRLAMTVDFATVTNWWIAAGQPLPKAATPGVWPFDYAEIRRQQHKLYHTRGKVVGWPLTAVTVTDPAPSLDETDGDETEEADETPVRDYYRFCDYPNPRSVNGVGFTIKVFRYGGGNAWGVFDWRGDRGAQLGPDGDWSYPPLDDTHRAKWRAERRFTEEKAVDLARKAAPIKTNMGKTIAEMLAWEAAQPGPNPVHPGDPDYERNTHHCWAMAVRDHHILNPDQPT